MGRGDEAELEIVELEGAKGGFKFDYTLDEWSRGDAGDVSLLSISQTILWGLSPTVGRTRPGYAYCPCSRKRTSDKCSHFAASTGVRFARLARAPTLFFFLLFLLSCCLTLFWSSPFFQLFRLEGPL